MNNLQHYAVASTAVAAYTVAKAFHDNPNFYSASIYLSQNYTASLIMGNFVVLSVFLTTHLLQRVIFGPLRWAEVRGIQQNIWVSVSEMALAMATFRDEFEASVLLIFSALLSAKVWAMILELRLEHFEQQEFKLSRAAHARLFAALGVLFTFTALMLRTCIYTVLEEAKPGVVLTFAYEFCMLMLTTISILGRYLLDCRERKVIRDLMTLQAQYFKTQDDMKRGREAQEQGVPIESIPPAEFSEDNLDLSWDDKPFWSFILNTVTDSTRISISLGFLVIMTMYHHLPLHIAWDLVMTCVRFINNVARYLRFYMATKDMNSRYPDATSQELQQDDTCVVCRQSMHAWGSPSDTGSAPRIEGLRPKKLPCGHILHMKCLKSWMERQAVCPTCRRSAIVEDLRTDGTAQQARPNNVDARAAGMRQVGIGPVRLMFGNAQQVREIVQRMHQEEGQAPAVQREVRFQAQNTNSNDQNRTGSTTTRRDGSSTTSSGPRTLSRQSHQRLLSRLARLHHADLVTSLVERNPSFLTYEEIESLMAFIEHDLRRKRAHLEAEQEQLRIIQSLASEVRELQNSSEHTRNWGTRDDPEPAETPPTSDDEESPPVSNPVPGYSVVAPGILVPPSWRAVPILQGDFSQARLRRFSRAEEGIQGSSQSQQTAEAPIPPADPPATTSLEQTQGEEQQARRPLRATVEEEDNRESQRKEKSPALATVLDAPAERKDKEPKSSIDVMWDDLGENEVENTNS